MPGICMLKGSKDDSLSIVSDSYLLSLLISVLVIFLEESQIVDFVRIHKQIAKGHMNFEGNFFL